MLMWALITIGALAAVLTIRTHVLLWRATRGPLPALDRTPRTATVVLSSDDEGRTILLRYRGVDGARHAAQLADTPDNTCLDAFAPGSSWQVLAFRNPDLADSVMFLTEAHDDVWRAGYVFDGVRVGSDRGPLKPGQGSPFLREDGKWRFEA